MQKQWKHSVDFIGISLLLNSVTLGEKFISVNYVFGGMLEITH